MNGGTESLYFKEMKAISVLINVPYGHLPLANALAVVPVTKAENVIYRW